MKRIILFTAAIVLLSACSSAPQADLFGEWKLVSYGDKTNPTPALPEVDTSITIKDGQLSGNVGCNSFGGQYQIKGDSISFGSIMSTEMYCDATWAQEQGVLAVFSSRTLKAVLSDNVLTLTAADGSVVILSRRDNSY
jgi:heat shock protein HslJ